MLQSLVKSLAAQPQLFDALRWLLEAGYVGHHAIIERELAKPGPLLDIGCGTGTFSHCFGPEEYLGIDLNERYIRTASIKHPLHQFAKMDARAIALPDDSQHRCLITGVLHHLSDKNANAVLSEAARVLQHDGLLIVAEDISARSKWNLIGRAIHALDLGQYIRTPASYRKLLSGFFRIESENPMSSGFMDYIVFRCKLSPH